MKGNLIYCTSVCNLQGILVYKIINFIHEVLDIIIIVLRILNIPSYLYKLIINGKVGSIENIVFLNMKI